MFFVVRSNDSFNFPLRLIKYFVLIVIVIVQEMLDTGRKAVTQLYIVQEMLDTRRKA